MQRGKERVPLLAADFNNRGLELVALLQRLPGLPQLLLVKLDRADGGRELVLLIELERALDIARAERRRAADLQGLHNDVG